MTTKQQVYREIVQAKREDRPINWRQLRVGNRSLQTREVSNDLVQIRFSDHESWLSPDDFIRNQNGKMTKDLSDCVSRCSQLFNGEQILLLMHEEPRALLVDAAVEMVRRRGDLTTNKEYNDLLHEHRDLEQSKANMESKFKAERENLLQEIDSYRSREEELENKLRSANHTICSLRDAQTELMSKFQSSSGPMIKRSTVQGWLDAL